MASPGKRNSRFQKTRVITRIIAEANNGDDLVESILKTAINRTLPYKSIRAQRIGID